MLASVNVPAGLFIAGLIPSFGNEDAPLDLGLGSGGEKSLNLCRSDDKSCVSSSSVERKFAGVSEDYSHFVPEWTFNPAEQRGGAEQQPALARIYGPKASREQAMQELKSVVTTIDMQDGFECTVQEQMEDYLYVTYKGGLLKSTDDVEFFFPESDYSIVEYRSARRGSVPDGKAGRARIKAMRIALEKKGWKSYVQ
eukprot:gene17469-20801_t